MDRVLFGYYMILYPNKIIYLTQKKKESIKWTTCNKDIHLNFLKILLETKGQF